ncbi:hypothetical protein ACFU0X_10255 [Streptomyces cellulosae]|uniref:Uncharacterized protein n=1 Tax=Streptomyces cellulosae TaxID=1968 RepID=A0ABW6JG73_STRCE
MPFDGTGADWDRVWGLDWADLEGLDDDAMNATTATDAMACHREQARLRAGRRRWYAPWRRWPQYPPGGYVLYPHDLIGGPTIRHR